MYTIAEAEIVQMQLELEEHTIWQSQEHHEKEHNHYALQWKKQL